MTARRKSLDGPVGVCLEAGRRRVFASALEWPGWSRPGRTADDAVETLDRYRARYRAALAAGGVAGPGDGPLVVTERVEGSATTDFGAPGAPAPSELGVMDASDADRLVAVLAAAWRAFDVAAATAPATLRKGPRGGGRDTAAVVDHLFDAEGAYARKVGFLKKPPDPGDPDGVAVWRHGLAEAVREAARSGAATAWPGRYAARRIAWHALDHAWEIEDRAAP